MGLVKIAEDVPQETKGRVAKARADMQDESFHVLTCPIQDNTCKEVPSADQVGNVPFLTGIHFYVNGVEGKVAIEPQQCALGQTVVFWGTTATFGVLCLY